MTAPAPLTIQPMSPAAIERVRAFEKICAAQPQVPVEIRHTLHAGMYARTVVIPAGVVITGVLVRVATILVVSGDAVMFGEGGPVALVGHHVLTAAAGRKQAFVARADTHLTMLFPTAATTVEEAEDEFTEEVDMLTTRREAK